MWPLLLVVMYLFTFITAPKLPKQKRQETAAYNVNQFLNAL